MPTTLPGSHELTKIPQSAAELAAVSSDRGFLVSDF
jgi:hypothetical protein